MTSNMKSTIVLLIAIFHCYKTDSDESRRFDVSSKMDPVTSTIRQNRPSLSNNTLQKAQRLCGYETFCSQTTSPEDQVVTNNRCCKPCYCSEDCWVFNDCCPDATEPTSEKYRGKSIHTSSIKGCIVDHFTSKWIKLQTFRDMITFITNYSALNLFPCRINLLMPSVPLKGHGQRV